MKKDNNGAEQAIFRKIMDDGTCWLFVTWPDQGWAITCDGKPVAFGTNDHASISGGVEEYLAFTSSKPLIQAECA